MYSNPRRQCYTLYFELPNMLRREIDLYYNLFVLSSYTDNYYASCMHNIAQQILGHPWFGKERSYQSILAWLPVEKDLPTRYGFKSDVQ